MQKTKLLYVCGGKALEHIHSVRAMLFLASESDTEKYDLQFLYLDELGNILTSRGHMTMAHDGQRLITEGLTTQQEITRVLGPAGE